MRRAPAIRGLGVSEAVACDGGVSLPEGRSLIFLESVEPLVHGVEPLGDRGRTVFEQQLQGLAGGRGEVRGEVSYA
ncbi:MAG: hypothetical protein OXK16_13225 [bacterium]|nr:hypothetical protein [bacterium]MDE0288878.1 hypothetical protein [bacterium]MDE0376906.1 hypothetical protein [bacterium]